MYKVIKEGTVIFENGQITEVKDFIIERNGDYPVLMCLDEHVRKNYTFKLAKQSKSIKKRTIEEYNNTLSDILGTPEKVGKYHYIFMVTPQPRHESLKYTVGAVCVETAEEVKSIVRIAGKYEPHCISRKHLFENPPPNKKQVKFLNKYEDSVQPTVENLDELLNTDLIEYKNQLIELILKEQ